MDKELLNSILHKHKLWLKAAHFCALDCDDEEYQKARDTILEFAKGSHRARELGLLE